MDWELGNISYLFLLLLLPILGWVMYAFVQWKKRKKRLFASPHFENILFEKKSTFSTIFPVFYLMAVLFLVLSMVDLVKGSEKIQSKQKMNHIIFMLDVSNSMNAEDVDPSRLIRAKNIMLSAMQNRNNDRVGIIIFAGESHSIMPLTTDFSAAETYISGIETNSIKIQGTDFLEAMKDAVEKFKSIPKGSRKIVLLSDGEDNEGNDEAAANLAKKEGISVISVGIGTEEGAPVPEYIFGQLMGYKTNRVGETVISKREVKALENISNKTGGSYIDGNNMDQAVRQINGAIGNNQSATNIWVKSENGIHYFQYFLGISLFFFFIILFFNPKREFNI